MWCFFEYLSSLKKPWRMTQQSFLGASQHLFSIQQCGEKSDRGIFFMWWCERLVSQLCSTILRDQLIKILLLSQSCYCCRSLSAVVSSVCSWLLPPTVVRPAVCRGSCCSLVFGLRYSNLLPPAGCSWSIYDFCLLSGYRADAEDATCSAELLLPPSALHGYHSWCRSDSSLCWIFLTGLI